MKAVMLSIRPEWCVKIAQSRKSMELRKSKPKLELPFRCYIYCTSNTPVLWRHMGQAYLGNPLADWPNDIEPPLNGKVIGEFVCAAVLCHCEMANADIAEQMSCVRREKIREYADGKEVYGWHISELVIYDKPKELSEFLKPCIHGEKDISCFLCEKSGYDSTMHITCFNRCQKPPQSWYYVEEIT